MVCSAVSALLLLPTGSTTIVFTQKGEPANLLRRPTKTYTFFILRLTFPLQILLLRRYLGLPTSEDNLSGYQASDVTAKAAKLRNKKYLVSSSKTFRNKLTTCHTRWCTARRMTTYTTSSL